ncbi:MAG: hypothetical protein EXR93_04555 [Gemmatimonadetes bacterium]|nr:hypothetical protein [Gemmatimonadota bacterium]
MGLKFQTDSLLVDVGTKLQFNNIAFSAFNFSFNQMLQTTQQTASVTFPTPPIVSGAPAVDVYPALPPPTTFATPGGSSVQSATIGAGFVVRTFSNGTGCAVTVNTTLTDNVPTVIASFPSNVVVANGATLIDSISAAGVTVNGFAQVGGSASVGVCVPGNPNIAAAVTFRPLTLSQVTLQNVNETFNQTFSAFAGESRVTAVDTIIVSSGSFSLTVQNRLPIADTITVRLNGITIAGVTQQQTLAVPAANGTGGTTTGTLTFNLAGARILPAAVIPQVTGTAKAASATITPTNATNAAVVSGGGSIVVQSLSGPLNPLTTPELIVATENTDEFTKSQIDLGDFEDAIKQSHLNSATVSLTIVNATQVPFALNNYKLGVVRLDGAGQPVRLPGGAPDFEKDASGQQILVAITDPGSASLTMGRGQTKTVSVNAAPLLDSLIHKLLNNTRMSLGVTGGITIGDGASARISRTDVIKVRFGLTIGLDITLPVGGVTFVRNQVSDGMDMDKGNADELATRLDKATASATVINGTPFGLTIQIGLVGDSLGKTANIFALPLCGSTISATCRVALADVILPPSTVNASGLVVTPATGSISVSLSGANSRVLFGKKLTAGIRIQLMPGTGGGGRGAIRATDKIVVSAKATVDIKVGGG